MRIQFYGTKALEKQLMKKSKTDFLSVAKKNTRDIFSRAARPGGTPVDSNELRMSAQYQGEEFGYRAPHGPHVEYGHRKVGGGFVPGQYFLKHNVDNQRPIYKQDLRNKLRE